MGLQIAGNAIKITCVEEVLENVFQLQSLLLRLSFVAACWWHGSSGIVLACLHCRQYYPNPPLYTAKMINIKKCRRHAASLRSAAGFKWGWDEGLDLYTVRISEKCHLDVFS